MKKITLLILITVLAFGCATLEYIPAYEQILGIDLRPYAENNFLITPYPYTGKYTSTSVVDYKIMPEANLVTISRKNTSTGQYESTSNWVIDKVNIREALDSIYFLCIGMGANALVDFEILETSDSYTGIQKPVVVTGIRITGLAIRRDDIEE